MLVSAFSTRGLSGLRHVLRRALLVCCLGLIACAPEPDGAVVFSEHCSSCHLAPLFPRAPHLEMMEGWNPDMIVTTLVTGLMEEQGRELTVSERTAVAEYISLGDAELDVDPRRARDLELAVP